MRYSLTVATLAFAAVVAATLIPESGRAQGQSDQLPMPPGGFKPPPVAPAKPYQPIAIKPPPAYDDPSFVAFRQQLAGIAQRRDRAALARLVVPQGFFWMQDKDVTDKRKSAVDNFAAAINLDAKDGSGWAVLGGYASEPTAAPLPDRPSLICAPADPKVDPKAFQALVEATQTEPPDWGYPSREGIDVRSAGTANAPVVEKLGLTLVRVLPDSAPPQDPNQAPFLHIVTPSGKTGFVPMEFISSLGGDAMCYAKGASGWTIAGYFGGAGQ
jgi:hypothetical protein